MLKSNPSYEQVLTQKRAEYSKLFDSKCAYANFQRLYYYSYDMLSHYQSGLNPDTIFNPVYTYNQGIPSQAKGADTYHPFTPAYYGLVWWNYAANLQTDIYNEKLVKIADYIIQNASVEEDRILFFYKNDFPKFNLKAPWISGITQSVNTSFLVRIYDLTKDEKYLQYAKKCLEPCTVPFDQGGVLVSTDAGMEWVEEYPSKPHSHVLNGFIFSIIAAHDVWEVTNDQTYLFHYKSWINSLVHHLIDYQFKQYMLYDKYQQRISNTEYQGLHVGQMQHLAGISESLLFYEFYRFYLEKTNWKRYYKFYGIEKPEFTILKLNNDFDKKVNNFSS